MASENSFDVVSKIEMQELNNAIQQAMKEITTRFDLKDSRSKIELTEKDTVLILNSADDYKLKAVIDILQSKMVKRGISLKAFTYGAVEPAAGGSVRQKATIQQGIPGDKAKKIVQIIKDAKLKVQASIQGETVRVSGKDRDTLQQVIALLRNQDLGLDLQFTNYRSN
jgi:uncharacterized protein YajQ (UPF0234 family)